MIKNVTIVVGKKDIKLTVKEARKLHADLDEIFKVHTEYIQDPLSIPMTPLETPNPFGDPFRITYSDRTTQTS